MQCTNGDTATSTRCPAIEVTDRAVQATVASSEQAMANFRLDTPANKGEAATEERLAYFPEAGGMTLTKPSTAPSPDQRIPGACAGRRTQSSPR